MVSFWQFLESTPRPQRRLVSSSHPRSAGEASARSVTERTNWINPTDTHLKPVAVHRFGHPAGSRIEAHCAFLNAGASCPCSSRPKWHKVSSGAIVACEEGFLVLRKTHLGLAKGHVVRARAASTIYRRAKDLVRPSARRSNCAARRVALVVHVRGALLGSLRHAGVRRFGYGRAGAALPRRGRSEVAEDQTGCPACRWFG